MPSTPTTTIEERDEQPWASPMVGENAAWFQRFSLYAAMGAGRSVRAVYNAELAQRNVGQADLAMQILQSQQSKAVPSSWTRASHRYEWQRRAKSFDAWRRKEVFATGNASDLARIETLDKVIEKLSKKCIAILDVINVESADIEQLAKLITALLSAMDLMAKHTGGYGPQRVEHTGKDGKAIEVEETRLNVFFYVPEVEHLEDPASDATVPGIDEEQQGDEQ